MYYRNRNSKTCPHDFLYKKFKNYDELNNFISKYKISGVYIISETDTKDIMYIGQSVNLCKRVPQSLFNKFEYDNINLTIDFILTNNDFDSYLVEVFLINKYLPKKNEGILFKNKPTVIENIDISRFNRDSFNLILK